MLHAEERSTISLYTSLTTSLLLPAYISLSVEVVVVVGDLSEEASEASPANERLIIGSHRGEAEEGGGEAGS